MFEKFDGSGRPLRDVQKQALEFIEQNIKTVDVIGINAPCGSGKSAIAKAIMDEFKDVVYITANNVLVKQMQRFYPELNTVIGKRHYTCAQNPELNCETAWSSPNHTPCGECLYSQAKRQALQFKQPTCYNAISYWYLQKDPLWKKPSVIIVDEADKLMDILMLVSGDRFGKKYKAPRCLDFFDVASWLKDKERLLTDLVIKDGSIAKLFELTKVQRVLQAVLANPARYIHFYDPDTGDLVISPIEPLKELVQSILNCDKLILLSATLYESDIKTLSDKPYKFIELDSPIPLQKRRVVLHESYFPFNHETPAEVVAVWIKDILKLYPDRNTLVHVTYRMADQLKQYFKGAYVNTKDNKEDVLKAFKESGGLWLASGCAEGLDLDGHTCSLNIIPLLPRPNIEDPIIKRRLAQPGGQRNYDIGVLKTIQQQAGRSTRGEDDYSTVVVGDRRLYDLVSRYEGDLPRSFKEQLQEGRRCGLKTLSNL